MWEFVNRVSYNYKTELHSISLLPALKLYVGSQSNCRVRDIFWVWSVYKTFGVVSASGWYWVGGFGYTYWFWPHSKSASKKQQSRHGFHWSCFSFTPSVSLLRFLKGCFLDSLNYRTETVDKISDTINRINVLTLRRVISVSTDLAYHGYYLHNSTVHTEVIMRLRK